MAQQAHAQTPPFIWEESLRGSLGLGMLQAEGLQRRELPPAFDEELRAVCDRLQSLYGGKQPADIPGVAETRALFHRLDIDPTKTRPSSEALLRRVLQGKGPAPARPPRGRCNPFPPHPPP